MYVAEQTLRVALGINDPVLIPAHRLIKKTTYEKHRIGRSSGEPWYFTTAGTTQAQVAGSTTTIGSSVEESTRLAMGWRVKITILGKTVYNDQGQKVGTVEDLIISPDRNVSYAIVGAGGFIGVGRHDVAIPVWQTQNENGKLVLPGATKDVVKSLPSFITAS